MMYPRCRLLSLLLVPMLILAGCSEQSPEAKAKQTAIEAVRNRLKAPSTAVFEPIDKIFILRSSNGNFLVSGYVDSENSFGAKLRGTWNAEIAPNGYEVILVSPPR